MLNVSFVARDPTATSVAIFESGVIGRASLRFDIGLADVAAEIIELIAKVGSEFRTASSNWREFLSDELRFDFGRVHDGSEPTHKF